jgi:hypothetical protein
VLPSDLVEAWAGDWVDNAEPEAMKRAVRSFIRVARDADAQERRELADFPSSEALYASRVTSVPRSRFVASSTPCSP